MILRLLARRAFQPRMLRVTSPLFLTLVLMLVSARLWLPGVGHWLARPSDVGQVDAIVALGGDNLPRIVQGVALYKQGLAPEIWHTGNVVPPSAAQKAIEHGVPIEAIHSLATTNTWEDGQQISTYAKQRQVYSILVVTHWYHSRRALCVIQQQLVGSGVSI